MRRLIAPLLAGSLLLASAGLASADEPAAYTLDPFYCTVTDQDGNILPENVIPAGSELFIFQGWLTSKKGQLVSFMNVATWSFSVNGQAMDVGPSLTGIFQLYPKGPWANFFIYDAGTLSGGASLDVHFGWVLRAANFDGSVHFAAGPVPGGVDHCLVSVAP